MSGLALVTGADGYLGLHTAQRLLTDTDDRLVLTVRAADRAELDAKRNQLASVLDTHKKRVEVVPADLTDDAPLSGVTRTVTAIVHAAARTAFNQSRDDARRINVEGTARVAEYAVTCPALDRFVLMSTLVSAGCRTGEVRETILAGDAGFANHYEWSKSEAELLLAERFPELPLTVARLSTIVADDDHGHVTQYNAFHNTLKLFFYGLITVVPGLPDTRLYLATAAATSGALVHLAQPDTPTGVYHLAPAPHEAISLREAIDTVFDVFATDDSFARRRLLRPEFCDQETFRHLVAATETLSASPAAGALRSVAPFAEQMFRPKQFLNTRLVQTWPGATAFANRALVHAVCQSLVNSRWGRKPGDRPHASLAS
ncbi:SDR family oxidoreductase [Streptomyces sp. NPDC058086]|uniref:SDR family oxidoreductase n=1 Tax=Streptomyces sp. NPDC058086 TaxID=3346334 RepID=UPI0036EAD835